ncbi:MAG: response regulator [Oscillospiraceae bacterium]|jgi:two-component system response regulator YesN|nr:response regulator [Oscillospiraceae bacterium]
MCNILVVEDVETERDGICNQVSLVDPSFSVKSAPNGKAALTHIEREGDTDIMLTDIEMPFLDGLDLCERASILRPSLKSLIISAHDDFEYAQRAINYGVCGFLLKPVLPAELRNAVLKAYQLWLSGQGKSGELPINGREQSETPALLRKTIRTVLKIIEVEYDQNIGLEYIAGQVYLTPSYLSVLFKNEMGVSLIRYINEFRLDKAKTMLLGSNRRIADISRLTGYQNLPYFYTVFKNRFGMTPAEMRELAARGEVS